MSTTLALALPIQPGKLDAWRGFVADLHGTRAADYRAHLARRGITAEQAFHQPTPQGDIAILVITCADPDLMVGVLATPHEPFDRWVAERLQELHGITPDVLAQLRPGTLVGTWPPAGVGAQA